MSEQDPTELAQELTNMQRRFVLNLVRGGPDGRGMSQREAYRKAGSKAKTDETLDANATEALSTPKVHAYYQALMAQAQSEAVMTREEALVTLSEIARTGSDTAKVKSEEGEDGETIVIMRATDRISAIRQMSAMQGWEAPKQHELAGKGGGPVQLYANLEAEEIAGAIEDMVKKL